MKVTKEQNSKQKKLNTNKGITLIALIITIIVMLILVAVTISMAVNGGLFNYAGKAAIETKNAINEEKLLAQGKIKVGGKWYDSIDDYIAGIEASMHIWSRTGDTFTCSHCNASYKMGEAVKYTATGTSTLYVDRLGIEGEEQNEINIESQKTNWIVLGIEDTNKDGVNETLLLTSKIPLPVFEDLGLPIAGAAAYNNGSSEINRICKELYSNKEYGEARGMTIEDVNSVFNYTPEGAIYFDGESVQQIEGFSTRLDELPEDLWNLIKNTGTLTPNPNDGDEETDLGAYELNNYIYWADGEDGLTLADPLNSNIKTITEVERNTIFGSTGEYFYHLASRGVGVDRILEGEDEFGKAGFGTGYVDCGEIDLLNWQFLSDVGGDGISEAYLRPVIVIKNNLPEINDVVEPDNIDDWVYTVEEDGTITINRYRGNDTVVTIPNYINGIPVKRLFSNTHIGMSASIWHPDICSEKIAAYYYIQSTITKVIIPEGITEICNGAFSFSYALEEISIPDSVQKIDNYAFRDCSELETIKLPSKLKTIGYEAFSRTGFNGEIVLPNSLEIVEDRIFYDMKNNVTISVPWKEGEKPEGWNEEWCAGDNITIKYAK